jgi:aminoglycoside 6'-N-acetyltransferase I
LIVRRATEADHPAWAAMLAQLHGDLSVDEFEQALARFTCLPEPYVGFIALSENGEPIGMIDTRIRNFAEGAPNLRAAYVEDLWVAPEHRGDGIATALLGQVGRWAREHGLDWLGSDARPDNQASHGWHRANGFEEIERLVVFGKRLD